MSDIPSPQIYFDLGEAIAALGLTIAIQQLLKPIFLFRLRAYGIRLGYLYASIFIGFCAVIVASIVGRQTFANPSIFQTTLFWELIGVAFIGGAYLLAVILFLNPARLYNFNFYRFISEAAHFLSKADDADRISFADELSVNLPRLINYTHAFRLADYAATKLAFEELRAKIGPAESYTLSGTQEPSAFYVFTHREALSRAYHASKLLNLFSDSKLCSVLVCKVPWQISKMLNNLAVKNIYSEQANAFIQEITTQGILNDDSMIAREDSYTGFSSIPVLSESLFENIYVLKNFKPFNTLQFSIPEIISDNYISRLMHATVKTFKTTLRHNEYIPGPYLFQLTHGLESVMTQLSFLDREKIPVGIRTKLNMRLEDIIRMLNKSIEADNSKLQLFYKHNKDDRKSDIIHALASLLSHTLETISNHFKGPNDPWWLLAHGIISEVFPTTGDHPDGLNPLQQQLSIQLIDKVKENMKGWYPALTRLLLATVGPYNKKSTIKNRTAFVIFKDAFYHELKKLPELNKSHPDKLLDYIPDNISYDIKSNTLTHTFFGGGTAVTELSKLKIKSVNFYDKKLWQTDKEPSKTS